MNHPSLESRQGMSSYIMRSYDLSHRINILNLNGTKAGKITGETSLPNFFENFGNDFSMRGTYRSEI